MTPEFARRILHNHPDLTGVSGDDRVMRDIMEQTRTRANGSLAEDLRWLAARMTATETYHTCG